MEDTYATQNIQRFIDLSGPGARRNPRGRGRKSWIVGEREEGGVPLVPIML